MLKQSLAFAAVLLLTSHSALAAERQQAPAPGYSSRSGWNDAGQSNYPRPDQQLGNGVFATYAPVYRTPGPNTYTYPHGTTVWYGTKVIPVAPAQPAPSPFVNAGSPAPVVIHIHQGRARHH